MTGSIARQPTLLRVTPINPLTRTLRCEPNAQSIYTHVFWKIRKYIKAEFLFSVDVSNTYYSWKETTFVFLPSRSNTSSPIFSQNPRYYIYWLRVPGTSLLRYSNLYRVSSFLSCGIIVGFSNLSESCIVAPTYGNVLSTFQRVEIKAGVSVHRKHENRPRNTKRNGETVRKWSVALR